MTKRGWTGKERVKGHVFKGLHCPTCKAEALHPNSQWRGKQRFFCKNCGWQGVNALGLDKYREGIDPKNVEKLAQKVREASGKKERWVVTSAQNATPVHKAFLETLKGYCKHVGARLLVIPYRYRNPTSQWTEANKRDDWWDKALEDYLIDTREPINSNLTLCADIKVQPTGALPLEGLETMTGPSSCIIGHPKVQMVTVPTPQQILPKIMISTGSCTKPNYTPTKAGKRGEFHHTFGAVIVEVDGELFHLRQINALKDGSFCDLNFEYSREEKKEIRVEGLVLGDFHREFTDPDVLKAIFLGKGSVMDVLKPKSLVWHDVHDFYAGSHHHRKNPIVQYVKHHEGRNNVELDLDETYRTLDNLVGLSPETNHVFVASNHPVDHFRRWVNETDPRNDPENAVFWAQTYVAMLEGSTMTPSGIRVVDPFRYWASKKMKTFGQVTFLEHNENHTIKGIEIGFHGDIGPHGKQGSVRSFGRIGVKSVIGHGHTPGISEGAYQVGTMSRLNLEYVRGPSGWLHTQCIIYPNGKRSLLNIIEGKWQA